MSTFHEARCTHKRPGGGLNHERQYDIDCERDIVSF